MNSGQCTLRPRILSVVTGNSWSKPLRQAFGVGLAVACVNLLPYRGFPADVHSPSNLPGCRIQGRVFEDLNRNGQAESNEPGLAGVIVTDSLQVTQTDPTGSYSLTQPTTNKFVFVIVPAGYRARQQFYCIIPINQTKLTADFALVTAPETAKANFVLAQITDLHVGNTNDAQNLVDDLETIKAFQPDLIIATGDLVPNGKNPKQWQNYLAAIRQSALPVIPVIGNHDADNRDGHGQEFFERHFGPSYYAFDFSRYHCVILNCMANMPRQYAWLEKELALQPKGKEILVFQHYPPFEGQELMQFLAGYNTVALFSGHWHDSKVMTYGKITVVNTPPLRFGGIDTSPREFRLISFVDGRMSISDHFPTCREHCVVVAPGAGAVLPQGRIKLQVKAYDASSPSTLVAYQLDDGPRKDMVPVGKFCYGAEEEIRPAGSHTFKVWAMFGKNSVARMVKFTVSAERLAAPRVGRAWPMFRHDAGRSGIAEETVMPPLRLAWTQPLGGTIHISSPVVAGDAVYIGIADEELRGLAGVCALDAVSGRIKWRQRTATSVKNTVTIYSNRVYGATVDGSVFALDAATGEMCWSFSLGDGLNRWLFASALVSDNTVYAGVGPAFVALDAATGKEIWRAKHMARDWNACISSPTLGHDKIFVGFNFNYAGLFALNRITGERIWNNNKLGDNYATPVFNGDLLYCGMLGRFNEPFHVLNADNGSVIWSNKVGGLISTPVVNGEQLVCGTTTGEVKAFEYKTGKKLWQYKTGQALLDFPPYGRGLAAIISSPAIAGQVVYVGGTDGKFLALNLEDGRLLWSYDLGCPITSSPAISGNTVYISTYDGTVYAFTSGINLKSDEINK